MAVNTLHSLRQTLSNESPQIRIYPKRALIPKFCFNPHSPSRFGA